MRRVRFLLYVLAVLAYAAMPINGMALELMDHQHSAMVSMEPVFPAAQDHSDCSGQHPGGKHIGMACGHCAACLTLPAQQIVLEVQSMVHAAPMPALGMPLFSQNNSPLVPPPRS